MSLQIILFHGSEGQDVTEMFEEISWKGRKGAAPRSLKIVLIDDDGHMHARASVDCEKGDQCIFYENGNELFRGIIISHVQDSSKKRITINAYDNMIYTVKNKDSFSYENKTATQIFHDCMSRLHMTGGSAVDTGYVIPALPKSKTTYYDVMLDALSMTYKATGIRYYISSEKGQIHLRRRSENMMQWVLETGDGTGNITSYSYSKSIENIKTRVRLLSKENTIVFEQNNSALESQIGTFMEVKSVDDSYNAAQIQELVQSVLGESGKPEQVLKVGGIGISEAISGFAVFVIIPQLNIQRTFYIDEDTHTFTRHSHTMSLKLNFAADINLAG